MTRQALPTPELLRRPRFRIAWEASLYRAPTCTIAQEALTKRARTMAPARKAQAGQGWLLPVVAAVLTALIFAAEFFTPLGFAHGTLYLVPVLAASLARNEGFILAMAVTGACLTLIGYLVSPAGFINAYALFNRMVSIAAIAGTTLLAVQLLRRSSNTEMLALQLQENRQRFEADSRQLSEELTDTLESITDALFTLDCDWCFTFVNRAAEVVLGRKREELLGRNIFELFPGSRQYRKHYEVAMLEGCTASFQGVYEALGILLDVRVFPKRDGIAVYFRDITEERELRERLSQAQRLEAVGQLTGGVAHDFNNLLTVIQGNLDLLEDALQDRPDLKGMAAMSGEAASRAAALTRHLLAFARRQALEPEAVDVQRLLDNMEPLLRRTLMESISIDIIHGPEQWPCVADAAQLENAVLNLCLNARDAMPEGGRLTIETANTHLDHDYAERHAEVSPGDYVQISVSDNGDGIPADMIDRVFDPFFTTKSTEKGSGLGLSMVFGFIKQSHGHITLYSEEGQGTTVRLYLPRSDSAPERSSAKPTAELPRGNEAILLVEDDELVYEYSAQALSSLGYRVLGARDGHEALTLLEGPKHVDLLFTDIVMPGGMNGRQLADEAQRRRPGLKVLFTSGYTENAVVHQGRLDPGVQLISKPYRRDELARRLRTILDTD